MTPLQIKKKVLAFNDWEWWAERPFGAFVMSMFKEGQTGKYMRKAGVDVEWPALFYQNHCFYKSEKVWDLFEKQLISHLDSGKLVFRIGRNCESYGRRAKKEIIKIVAKKISLDQKLKKLYDIFNLDIAFVWLVHGLEHHYKKRLNQEVPKYFKGDIDKFIGDISFPSKKNVHYYLEQALRGKENLEQIQKKFGWIKVRDGFSDPYSIKELATERKRLKHTKPEYFKHVSVPKQLKKFAKIAQELVYLRTLRTDILYELMFLSRPIFMETAKKYRIPFKDMKYYSFDSLVLGKPKRFPENVTAISYGRHFAFFPGPILNDKVKNQTELRGVIANHGLAKGRAKIVKTAYEIGKINKGDILFAPTTAPSYIIGMRKAAAFVTDEGGITSHAAIVSREMGKPCIIGTKIGTRIFKDDDMVEVDAHKGIVRKLS